MSDNVHPAVVPRLHGSYHVGLVEKLSILDKLVLKIRSGDLGAHEADNSRRRPKDECKDNVPVSSSYKSAPSE